MSATIAAVSTIRAPKAVYAEAYVEKMSKLLEKEGRPADQYTAPFVNAVNLVQFTRNTIAELKSKVEEKNVLACVNRAHFLRAITPYATEELVEELKAVEHFTKHETMTQWIQMFKKSETPKVVEPVEFDFVEELFGSSRRSVRVQEEKKSFSGWTKPTEDNFVMPLIVRVAAPEEMPKHIERSYWLCFGQMFCLILFNESGNAVYRPCWDYKPTLESLLAMFDGRRSTICPKCSVGVACTFIHPVVEEKKKVQVQTSCCDSHCDEYVIPRDYKTVVCKNKAPHNAAECNFLHPVNADNTFICVEDKDEAKLVHYSKLKKNSGLEYLVAGIDNRRVSLKKCVHGEKCNKGFSCTFAHFA